MATLSKGHTFSGGETVTAAKLNSLVDSATISNIVNDDVSATAAIAGTKISPNFGSQTVSTTGTLSAGAGSVISGNTSTDALRITQSGSGNALVVEDSTSPDATPLVVNNLGQIISGATTAFNSVAGLQITADSASAPNANIVARRNSSDSAFANVAVQKARGTTASPATVNSQDGLGAFTVSGYDGSNFVNAATIRAIADAAPSAGFVPGALQFMTTSPTAVNVERMRITSSGNVGINQASPATTLDVVGTVTATGFSGGTATLTGSLTLSNASDIIAGTGAGTKIGTATTQKIGFWNVTPVVQPAAAGQAAAAAQTQDSLTDSTGGTASTTLAAITAGASYDQADMTAIKNAIASLASQLAKIRTDVANIKTLQDASRTALVNTGIMKGAA
jgi:hypothetical protein